MRAPRVILGVCAVISCAGATARAAGAPHRPPKARKTIYVDCGRHQPGSGTRRAPLSRLEAASRMTVGPGWRILFRRGSTCHGYLAPRGSGSRSAPVLIAAYGRGSRPRIVADGSAPDAVRLADESYITVQDLEITNRGDYSSPRRGVHVLATHGGQVRHVVLRRLYIHDVQGGNQKDLAGSGGIQVDDPTADILLERNRIEDVNRSGIWVQGRGTDPRPLAGRPWPSATTGVRIRGNRLARIGGDGIVPTGTDGAVVEDNIVCCANLRGRFPTQFDAGIWTFHANGTVIQRNEVYGMRNGTADGTGYDIDYNQDGTIVQHNFGHDNAGGFILLCTTTDEHRRADVRFNLSVDEYVFSESPCQIQSGQIGTLDGLRVFNNTFVTPSSLIWNDAGAPLPALPQAGDLKFVNNIVYATVPQATPFPCGGGCTHNLFFNLPPSGSAARVADPRFLNAGARGNGRITVGRAFRLARGSPAIGAGVAVARGADEDYFGHPIPDPPSIGFAQPTAR